MRNRNNLLLLLLSAVVVYLVFYKKGNGSGNGSGNGNGYGKPNNDFSEVDESKFPSAGKDPNIQSGTMDLVPPSKSVKFL